jgi:hypothetical protein
MTCPYEIPSIRVYGTTTCRIKQDGWRAVHGKDYLAITPAEIDAHMDFIACSVVDYGVGCPLKEPMPGCLQAYKEG